MTETSPFPLRARRGKGDVPSTANAKKTLRRRNHMRASTPHHKLLARTLRTNATKEEQKLWYDFLSTYPVRFLRQKVIDKYIADFYCAKARLVVELDGSQHFEKAASAYDSERTEAISDHGLLVVRFTNLEVDQEFRAVCDAIHAEVTRRL